MVDMCCEDQSSQLQVVIHLDSFICHVLSHTTFVICVENIRMCLEDSLCPKYHDDQQANAAIREALSW